MFQDNLSGIVTLVKKEIIKRVIIITILINVVIALFIGGKITIEKSKEEIAKRFPSFSKPALFDGFGKSACTDGEDYHAQLVYARAKDTISRYQELAPKLSSWFKSGDAVLNEEAKKFKMSANLKVLCENGEISVIEAVLPNTGVYYLNAPQETRKALIKDLGQSGYDKENTKYIVWYDGKASGCGGKTCISQQSIKGPDDQLSEDNVYNLGPDYALLYKVDDAEVQQLLVTSYDMVAPILMLHEYAHTLEAVQASSPHATKKESSPQKHCTDSPTIGQGGTDIMCKSDAPGEVFGNSCPGFYPFRFDCNNDDYFNPKPEPGSYLATHWNLGSPLNRFIRFGQ